MLSVVDQPEQLEFGYPPNCDEWSEGSMTIEEQGLLQELDDALKRLPEEVSKEDVLCFLEATNYHELNKLDVRVLPSF